MKQRPRLPSSTSVRTFKGMSMEGAGQSRLFRSTSRRPPTRGRIDRGAGLAPHSNWGAEWSSAVLPIRSSRTAGTSATAIQLAERLRNETQSACAERAVTLPVKDKCERVAKSLCGCRSSRTKSRRPLLADCFAPTIGECEDYAIVRALPRIRRCRAGNRVSD